MGQAVIARQMIRKVLEGRLMMPEEDEDGRRYRFTGHAGIGRLVLATPIAKNMVTRGGFAGVSTVELHGVIRVAEAVRRFSQWSVPEERPSTRRPDA